MSTREESSTSFPESVNVSKAPLELIFSDVWGPAPTSAGKHNYYVSFIDDFSKFTWIYLLQHMSEVFQKLHDFQTHVERLFDRKVLAIQTDWGGGGKYHKLHNFLSVSAYPIMSHVHTHISRMALLNASIVTLLRQV
jgi:hypothetical protein